MGIDKFIGSILKKFLFRGKFAILCIALYKKIKSLKSTFLGGSNYQQNVEKEIISNEEYFWIKPDKKNHQKPLEGSDIWAIDHNYISISKIDPFFLSSSNDNHISLIIDSINKKYFN